MADQQLNNNKLHYLMKVPDALEWAVHSGRLEVAGAVLRDKDLKRVVGHLQHTGVTMERMASAAGGGPAAALAQLGSSVVANVQLEQVKDMLSTVQALSTVAAAASVLNLGVSIAGFAIIANKIDGLGSRIDALAAKVERLHKIVEAQHRAKLKTALDRCEEAYQLKDDATRHTYWRNAEKDLHELTNFYLELLSSVSMEQLMLEMTIHEISELISWIVEAARARIEILLLLGEPSVASRFAHQVSERLKALEATDVEVATLLLRGKTASTVLRNEVLKVARGYAKFSHRIVEDFDQLCNSIRVMDQQDVDTRRYIMEARQYDEQAILFFPEDDELIAEIEKAYAAVYG